MATKDKLKTGTPVKITYRHFRGLEGSIVNFYSTTGKQDTYLISITTVLP